MKPGANYGWPVVPGGRVDLLPAREAPRASKGAATDHISFEVADLDAVAKHLKERGGAFDCEPQRIDAINLSIAFITDPAGVYIELTEGLDDARRGLVPLPGTRV